MRNRQRATNEPPGWVIGLLFISMLVFAIWGCLIYGQGVAEEGTRIMAAREHNRLTRLEQDLVTLGFVRNTTASLL